MSCWTTLLSIVSCHWMLSRSQASSSRSPALRGWVKCAASCALLSAFNSARRPSFSSAWAACLVANTVGSITCAACLLTRRVGSELWVRSERTLDAETPDVEQAFGSGLVDRAEHGDLDQGGQCGAAARWTCDLRPRARDAGPRSGGKRLAGRHCASREPPDQIAGVVRVGVDEREYQPTRVQQEDVVPVLNREVADVVRPQRLLVDRAGVLIRHVDRAHGDGHLCDGVATGGGPHQQLATRGHRHDGRPWGDHAGRLAV